MKNAFAAIVLLAAAHAGAADDTWVPVSESVDTVFEMKSGSVERGTTERSREPIIAFLVRARDKKSTSTQFEKNYVKLADCKVGYGKLVTTELDGRARYSSDFVLDGGNIASALAGTLCSLVPYTDPDAPADFRPRTTAR